jgi:nickel/cobalt transporter (NiCoT) family protein
VVVLGLHVIGFVVLLVLVAPRGLHVGKQGAFGLGIGTTAYTLGLRHAFDADHIAAIDNATRKLMADGKRPLSVGFFFSLGHSSIVFVLALLFAVGLKAFGYQVAQRSPALHVVGTSLSGAFLYVLGILNLIVLVEIVRVYRRMRGRELAEPALEAQLARRGVMSRFVGRFTTAVNEPWHMYPIGLLFGLGFDTATEVAVLFLAAGAAISGLPFYAILCLPVLFAAGMSLIDTLDGAFMSCAYGWAFSDPLRKVYYNIAVTGLSVAVALGVGTLELASVLTHELGLSQGVWGLMSSLDFSIVGYMVVGLFVVTWLAAVIVWRSRVWSVLLRLPAHSFRRDD